MLTATSPRPKTNIRIPKSPGSRVHFCNHCGCSVDRNELILLRERCALPQEPTLYLHEDCADRFIERYGSQWVKIPRDSFEAGWLLY